MMDDSTLIETLIRDGSTLILRYGSSVTSPPTANDTDLYAIYSDSKARNHFQLDQWDVTRFSEEEFQQYRQRLDPLYATEPFLTGELVHGTEEQFQEIQGAMQRAEPTSAAIGHNIHEAVNELEKASKLLSRNQQGRCLRSLSFALSHWAAARWYTNGNSPTAIETVLEESHCLSLFNEVRSKVREVESNSTIDKTSLQSYRNQVYRRFL